MDGQNFADRDPESVTRQREAIVRRLYAGLGPRRHTWIDADGRKLRPSLSSVYGELSAPGIEQLLSVVPIGRDDVFVDLGSGLGKVVMHVALAAQPALAVGVEIERGRHETAILARARAEWLGLIEAGRCAFRNEDVRVTDLGGATVLFANAICFSETVMRALFKRIAALEKPVTLVSLHTLKRMPVGFDLVDSHVCETSWSARESFHVYRTRSR